MQREYYIGFGLIFLLMSALVITFAFSSTTREKPVVVDSEEKSWSVNGTINAGERFFLYIVPPKKWHTGVADVNDYYPYGYIDVIVEIVNSSGRMVAKFQYTWARAKNPYTGAYFIAAANVTVRYNEGLIDPGAIEVGALGGCGGIASYTDNYTVRICDIVPRTYYKNPSYSDPPTLELIKAELVIEYPNTYMLWLGIPLLILGVYLPIHPSIKKIKTKKLRLGELKRRGF